LFLLLRCSKSLSRETTPVGATRVRGPRTGHEPGAALVMSGPIKKRSTGKRFQVRRPVGAVVGRPYLLTRAGIPRFHRSAAQIRRTAIRSALSSCVRYLSQAAALPPASSGTSSPQFRDARGVYGPTRPRTWRRPGAALFVPKKCHSHRFAMGTGVPREGAGWQAGRRPRALS
jgi:hypothetical protein